MPLYEYQCQKCQEVSELLQKISDPAPHACPKCQADEPGNMVKQISRTNFVLKGTGWYETDFKSKPKSGSDGNGSDGNGSDNKSTEGKTGSDGNGSGNKSTEGKTGSDTTGTSDAKPAASKTSSSSSTGSSSSSKASD